jgi:hypothetical protein
LASLGGEPVKQDVVLVASEDAETRQELAERLDWDDVPFLLASSAEEALEVVLGLRAGRGSSSCSTSSVVHAPR